MAFFLLPSFLPSFLSFFLCQCEEVPVSLNCEENSLCQHEHPAWKPEEGGSEAPELVCFQAQPEEQEDRGDLEHAYPGTLPALLFSPGVEEAVQEIQASLCTKEMVRTLAAGDEEVGESLRLFSSFQQCALLSEDCEECVSCHL